MHSTDDLNDGYMGSGTKITRSLRKYGQEGHKFEVLEYFPDRRSLIMREAEIITSDLLQDPLCMNLMLGGSAAPYPRPISVGQKISAALKGKPNLKTSVALKGRKNGPMSLKRRQNISNAMKSKKRPFMNQCKKGIPRSIECKAKISAALTGKPWSQIRRNLWENRKKRS
jgi:hypothetical protein